jgi:hypothetical protein
MVTYHHDYDQLSPLDIKKILIEEWEKHGEPKEQRNKGNNDFRKLITFGGKDSTGMITKMYYLQGSPPKAYAIYSLRNLHVYGPDFELSKVYYADLGLTEDLVASN